MRKNFSARSVLPLLFLALLTAEAPGVPMWDGPSTARQPDGTAVEVRLFGDEFHHWAESPEGYTVVRDPVLGWYCYADVSPDGTRFLSTGIPLGNPPPEHLAPGLQLDASAVAGIVARGRSPGGRAPDKILDKPPVITGEVLGLTILVDFPDLDFETEVPDPVEQQAWMDDVHDFLNLPGYTGHGNNGSVFDYFTDVSGNNLSYTNQLTDRFYESTAPRGALEAGVADWDDVVTDILQQMDAEGFDFSPFDANADGMIDAISIYYWGPLGFQELWPHYSDMLPVDLDGLTAEHYMVSALRNFPELRTYCHETGHLLGQWPDLYSVALIRDGYGLGDYCLMAYAGSNDLDPVHPSAFPKKLAGWLVPTVLDRPGLGLTATSGDNSGYIIPHPDPDVTTEYFLIENRQETGRDERIDDSGLAIYHVDEQKDAQEFSTHDLVHLVQADGLWELENGRSFGNATDLFAAPDYPDYDPYSDPRARWWEGDFIESVIQNVSTSGPVMTFDYPGCSQLASVTVSPPDLGFEWTMTGPGGFSLSGSKNNEFIVPTCGQYTVSFENVPLYNKPADVSRGVGATGDPAIDFAGTYALAFRQGGPNDLGDTGRATALSAVDYDDDGDEDLFIANFGKANRLLINQGGSGFSDVTPPVLANAVEIVDASWADADNDGDQDLFLVRARNDHLVLEQQDGTLVDVSGQCAALCTTGDASAGNWGDIDNDGALDIFLARYNQDNEVYKGVLGPTVRLLPGEISRFAGRGAATSGVHWGDINHDGWNDLLLNAPSSAPVDITRVLQNFFGEYQFWSGRVNTIREGVDAAWADFNNDGLLDMAVLESNGAVVFYLVGPGGFVTFSNPVSPSPGATSLAAGDFNNDGWVDLYVTRIGGSDMLVVNRLRTAGDMIFSSKTLTFNDPHMLGDNEVAVTGDFNRDGKLDLYVARNGAPNFLIENRAGGDNHWLEVKLTGRACNRDALGARITVVADGLSQVREVQSEGGSGQNSPVAHFGLGSVGTIDFVTVSWPGGAPMETYDATLAVDARLSITQQFSYPVVTSYIARDGQQLPIAATPLRGCPAGDDDELVIVLDFDDASMEDTPQIPPEYVSLVTQGLEHGFRHDTSRDTPGTAANGYQVTLRRAQAGGCNEPDSGPATLDLRYLGLPVGSLEGFRVQSPDITGDGWVNLADVPEFSSFLVHQQGTFNEFHCADFVHDGVLNTQDLVHFASHFGHRSPDAVVGSDLKAVSDARIRFVPSIPATDRAGEMRMQVVLDRATSLNAVAAVLDGMVGDYRIIGWEVDPGLSDRVVLIGRDGDSNREWVLLGLGLGKETIGSLPLGFLVLAPSPDKLTSAAAPTTENFNLLAGEIMTADGSVASLLETDGGGPLPARSSGIQRVYPNPFNPAVTIEYALDHPARVTLRIHDLAGRLVATLVNENQAPHGGIFSAVWDGRNDQGRKSPSGLYFWRLAIGDQVETGRMMLIE